MSVFKSNVVVLTNKDESASHIREKTLDLRSTTQHHANPHRNLILSLSELKPTLILTLSGLEPPHILSVSRPYREKQKKTHFQNPDIVREFRIQGVSC